MNLASLNPPLSPATLTVLAGPEIVTVDDLRLVLSDPRAGMKLEAELTALALARCRAAAGMTAASPAPSGRVETVTPETMPMAELLAAAVARPDDEHVQRVARQRIPRVVTRGIGLDSIDQPATLVILQELASVHVSSWPAKYRGGDVATWERAVPTSVPIWDPLTGEPVVQGRTSKSGLRWEVPPDSHGFLAFVARDAAFRREHNNREILEAFRTRATEGPEWEEVQANWGLLSESGRLSYAETLTAPPRPLAAVDAHGQRGAPGARTKHLDEVLRALFSSEELHRLVTWHYSEFSAELPGVTASHATYADALVRAVVARGYRDHLVALCLSERPRREAELRAWLGM